MTLEYTILGLGLLILLSCMLNAWLIFRLWASETREAVLREIVSGYEYAERTAVLVNEGPPAAGSILDPMYGAQS